MGIEVTGLSYAYRGRPALRDVSFGLGPGEALFVLGPNGAGKSTLFRCILGLLGGYGGDIRVEGKDLRRLTPDRLARVMAYIPQSHSPGFSYDVMTMVLMGAAPHTGLFAAPGASQRRVAGDILERLGIGHLRDRGYASLSGGERQLTLIARALMQQARILVMDEPTASLDYGNQLRVYRVIRELSDGGYAILLSTHNPQHAFLFADRVLVIRDGRAEPAGPPRRVLTEELLRRIYGVSVRLVDAPPAGNAMPMCVPGEGSVDVCLER